MCVHVSSGGLAVGVPGEVEGFHESWKRYGRVSWEKLFLPTIRLCEEGFKVEKFLADRIKRKEDVLRSDPNFR